MEIYLILCQNLMLQHNFLIHVSKESVQIRTSSFVNKNRIWPVRDEFLLMQCWKGKRIRPGLKWLPMREDLHKSSDSVQLLSLSHYFLPASNNFIWLDNHTQAHVLDEYFSFCLMRNWRGNTFLSNEKHLEQHYNFVFIKLISVKQTENCVFDLVLFHHQKLTKP